MLFIKNLISNLKHKVKFHDYFIFIMLHSKFILPIINFFKHPIIIKFKHNLIIGSLGLIVIKFFFSTTLIGRLLLFFSIAFYSFLIEGKEKIQELLSNILRNALGYEYYSEAVGYSFWDKRDFLHKFLYERNRLYKFPKMFRILYFEISYFIRGLIFQAYAYIAYFRFIFDRNPYISIIIYYIIIINIIYYDIRDATLYIGLFLIVSKLLIYRVEHSFQEVKQAIYLLGLNDEILEKQLLICRSNYILLLYWNLRDLNFNRATISLYDKAALSYIHLMVQSLRDDSLFELAQGNTLLFYFNSKAILNSGPFHTLSFYIPHAKASSQLQNYSNNGRTLISICPEHKNSYQNRGKAYEWQNFL